MDAIINTLSEHLNSAVFVLLIVLAASYWSVYKITQFITHWGSKDEDLSSLKQRWDDDIPNIKNRVDLIFQRIYPQTAIQSESPARLTKTGKDISESLGANKIIEQYRKPLVAYVESHNPNNAYDLQQECFAAVERHLESLLDNKQLQIAKQKSLEYGIPLDNALAVFAVLLRDILMKEKGWLSDDVDRHDPNFNHETNSL